MHAARQVRLALVVRRESKFFDRRARCPTTTCPFFGHLLPTPQRFDALLCSSSRSWAPGHHSKISARGVLAVVGRTNISIPPRARSEHRRKPLHRDDVRSQLLGLEKPRFRTYLIVVKHPHSSANQTRYPHNPRSAPKQRVANLLQKPSAPSLMSNQTMHRRVASPSHLMRPGYA